VVGGGPPGVEMAGATSDLIRLVLRKDYRDLDINEVRVVLIEAAPYVLVQFVPSLREAALHSLRRKGIEVMLETKVEAVTDSAVKLAGGEEINARTVIWTAGVKASALAQATGVPLVRQSRIKVEPSAGIPPSRSLVASTSLGFQAGFSGSRSIWSMWSAFAAVSWSSSTGPGNTSFTTARCG